MKKLAIRMLLVMAVIAAIGLITVQSTIHRALAASVSTANIGGTGFTAATGSTSHTGGSGSAAGNVAICPRFVAIHGTCSESPR